jgi:hypothetical protein
MTAALCAGIHPERARRWLKVPRFQRAILRDGSPLTNAPLGDLLWLGVEGKGSNQGGTDDK